MAIEELFWAVFAPWDIIVEMIALTQCQFIHAEPDDDCV